MREAPIRPEIQEERRTPSPSPLARKTTRRRMTRGLVALSSAAILSVYAAGYLRTESAAERVAAVEARTAELARPAATPSVSSALSSSQDVADAVDPTSTLRVTNTPVTSVAVNSSTQSAAINSVSPTDTPIPPTPVVVSAPVSTATPTSAPAGAKYRDGTYLGSGMSRHGGVEARVVVKGGKIVSAAIARTTTRYSPSVIASLPGEVVAQQSPNVDFVSGASDSSSAYEQAVMDALSQASGSTANG